MEIIKGFVREEMPTKSCHASTVLPLPDGKVICAWFGGTREKNSDVDIWYSIKDNDGFSCPKRITANKNIAHWNPVLFRKKNGEICLFFKVGKEIARWKTYVSVSKDNGETFSEPKQLVKGDRSGGRGPVKDKCIRLKSGRVLAPASTEHTGWNCFVDISDDDGETWKKSKRVATEYCKPALNKANGFCMNKIPMIQPTLWESDSGTVHMLTRTKACKIYRSDSYDGGETWCRAYPTDLPNNNSGIDLVKTPDGDIYLLSNPVGKNHGPRSPLTLSVSHDDGDTFETIATLENQEGGEFSYPAIEYLAGSLYMSYTYNRENIVFATAKL